MTADFFSVMKIAGYTITSSGGGCTWFTKPITFLGQEAYIAITNKEGLAHPESVDEPVIVGVYDTEFGEPFLKQEFSTLKKFLGSFWLERIGAQ